MRTGIGRRFGSWRRATARFRAGAEVAIRTGVLIGDTARVVGTAPIPPMPDTARRRDAGVEQVVNLERDGTARLRDYGRYELDRRVRHVGDAATGPGGRDVRNPPAAVERSRTAVAGRGRQGRGRQGREARGV